MIEYEPAVNRSEIKHLRKLLWGVKYSPQLCKSIKTQHNSWAAAAVFVFFVVSSSNFFFFSKRTNTFFPNLNLFSVWGSQVFFFHFHYTDCWLKEPPVQNLYFYFVFAHSFCWKCKKKSQQDSSSWEHERRDILLRTKVLDQPREWVILPKN